MTETDKLVADCIATVRNIFGEHAGDDSSTTVKAVVQELQTLRSNLAKPIGTLRAQCDHMKEQYDLLIVQCSELQRERDRLRIAVEQWQENAGDVALSSIAEIKKEHKAKLAELRKENRQLESELNELQRLANGEPSERELVQQAMWFIKGAVTAGCDDESILSSVHETLSKACNAMSFKLNERQPVIPKSGQPALADQ